MITGKDILKKRTKIQIDNTKISKGRLTIYQKYLSHTSSNLFAIL